MNSAKLLPCARAAMLGWHSTFKRTGHSRSRHQIGHGGLRIHAPPRRRRSAAARRRTGSPDRSPLRRPRGGNPAGSAPRDARRSSAASAPAASASVVAPSLRMSSSAYSRRSKDFMTAGSRCCPAFVSTSACGWRSKSCAPINFSSAITWRDKALCEINSALAAAVKLRVLGDALEGAQRVQRQPAAIDGGLAHDAPYGDQRFV